MHPTKKTAHIAGAVYFSTLPLALYFWIYIPGKLIVRGNASATADNILAHESLFRFSIWGGLFGYVVIVYLAFLLYRVLCGVERTSAFMMVGFALLSAAVGFSSALPNIAAVILFRGNDFLAALDKPQRDALAMFFLRLNGQGELTNEIFSGLWLFPMGWLVFRSGFLPRVLGIWLIVAGFGWLTLSFIALTFPSYYDRAFSITQPVVLGEMAFALWLLFRGVNTRRLSPDETLPVG
jgi:hypothetical protein